MFGFSKKIEEGDNVSFKEDVQEAVQSCQGVDSAPTHRVLEVRSDLDMALIDNGRDGQEQGWFTTDNFYKR